MVTPWTASEILAGAAPETVPDEEVSRRCREAMGDPETVSLVVIGRNGQKVEIRISSHERTLLELTEVYDQEERPEERWFHSRSEVWAPRWKSFTWTVTQHFYHRAEDLVGL